MKIVVLVNSDLADRLGVVVFPSISFESPLLGALRVLLRLLPKPCRPAAGNPRAPPSTRGSAALGEAAETDPGGSTSVGLVVHSLARVAVRPLLRATRDGPRLASERLSPVLNRANPTGHARPAGPAEGGPRFDSYHEPGEPTLGRAADPRRTVEARPRNRGNQREQIPGPPPETTLPDLVNVPREPLDEYGFR
jgi:hypothetical protein